MKNLKRAAAVFMCAVMTVMSAAVPSYAEDKTQSGELSFATLTGVSYVSEENRGGYNDAFLLDAQANGYQYEQLDGLLDSSFEAIKEKAEKEGLKYLLVNGNMTYSGETENHEAFAEKLREFEEETGVQVIAMAGRKDINNASASSLASGERKYITALTAGRFASVYADLGYDLAVNRHNSINQNTGNLSYSVILDDEYRLVVIDPSYFTFKGGYTEVTGVVTDSLMNWIKNECSKAEALGQTVIGMCSWSLSGSDISGSADILTNADEVADTLADIGMHYIYTSGTGKNDITALISDKGNVIYDIQTAPLAGFPNTFRVSSFEDGVGTFDIADADEVKPIVSRDGTEFSEPYRETASLKIQYTDYDLARYCADMIKNYVGTVLIPGVSQYGTLERFLSAQHGISIADEINNLIGGGLTLFDLIVIFDGANIMNLLENMFEQAQTSFLRDDETLAELCYESLKEVFDFEISSEPCDAFIDTYGFGSTSRGGTVGDLILSMIVYSRYGNEDISKNAFMKDVTARLTSGELVTELADILSDTLIKDLLFGDILSQIEFKPEYLLFFDDTQGSLGYYFQIFFNFYVMLHGENPSVTGALNSMLNDRLIPSMREYGSSVDEVVDHFIDYYFGGDNKTEIGYQLANLVSSYVTDSDPKVRGDHGVTYDGSAGSAAYVSRKNYRLPSMVTVTPGSDTKTQAYITWYTKSTVTGTNIELYTGKNATFYGKHYIDPAGVAVTTENQTVERTYNILDLGFISFGKQALTLTRHTMKLTGLKAGTTYYLRVGDSAKGWWSDTITVTTAGGGDSLSFIHVSDTFGNTPSDFDAFRNVLGGADYLFPNTDFILHTGNYVDNKENINQWQMLLDGNDDDNDNRFLSEYIVPVAGSGDTVDDIKNNFAVDALLGNSGRKGVYYSFDYNSAHIAVLDSNFVNSDGTLAEEQLQWFKADMGSSNAKWKIVAVHDPVYTNGASSQGDNYKAYMKQMTSLMDQYNVDLLLSGNDGVYYRTNSMLGGSNENVPMVNIAHPTNSSISYNALKNPTGTVYSALSSSGSYAYEKHEVYDVSGIFDAAGKKLNTQLPMFSAVEIIGDSLYLTTYSVEETSQNTKKLTKTDSIAITKGVSGLGDVNFDGRITASDARIVLRASANLVALTTAQRQVADVNSDGRITASDARKILRVSASLEKF